MNTEALQRLQSIFNTVKEHLLTQNEKSLKHCQFNTECRYRGDGGTKCAVGFLIKDEYYSPDLEGVAVCLSPSRDLVSRVHKVIKALEASLGYSLNKAEISLLSFLQGIHDNNTIDYWEEALDNLEGRLEHIYKMNT